MVRDMANHFEIYLRLILHRNLWYKSQSVAGMVHVFTCPPKGSHIGNGYLGEAILGLGKSVGPE